MLIKPDSKYLGDKIVLDEEAIAKHKEETLAMRHEKHAIAEQDVLANKEMALGQPMAWTELVRRLKLLNPNLVIQDGGYPNAIAVRIQNGNETEYVTGFMKEVLPEYSWVTLDQDGIAKHEKRGWRQVVFTILQRRLATYGDAVRIFGQATGARSTRHDREVRDYKN